MIIVALGSSDVSQWGSRISLYTSYSRKTYTTVVYRCTIVIYRKGKQITPWVT